MRARLKALAAAVWNFVRNEEPVVIWHAGAALLALYVAVRAGHASYGLFADAWLAVQALGLRKSVTPSPDVSNSALARLVAPESPPAR